VIVHGDQKYAVDDDAVIENLLTPYHAWKSGQVDYPVVVGETRNKRPMLVPAPGAGVKKGFFIYWQGAVKDAARPPVRRQPCHERPAAPVGPSPATGSWTSLARYSGEGADRGRSVGSSDA
jgi:hypothetical protein